MFLCDGRGDEIRTHDDDFKDRCLRPLGDTPTMKQDSIFWLFFKKRFLMFAVAILKHGGTTRTRTENPDYAERQISNLL